MKINQTIFASICFLLLSPLSQAGESLPFKATFHGFVVPATPAEGLEAIVVALQGTATHLGKFEERLVHYINPVTFEFTGYADWTAANGDTLTTVFEGHLYPTNDLAWLGFEVTHQVVGGTGRFSGATGSFTGINGRFSTVTGEDLGGYVGTISY